MTNEECRELKGVPYTTIAYRLSVDYENKKELGEALENGSLDLLKIRGCGPKSANEIWVWSTGRRMPGYTPPTASRTINECCPHCNKPIEVQAKIIKTFSKPTEP